MIVSRNEAYLSNNARDFKVGLFGFRKTWSDQCQISRQALSETQEGKPHQNNTFVSEHRGKHTHRGANHGINRE
jgi:hypothetical protein